MPARIALLALIAAVALAGLADLALAQSDIPDDVVVDPVGDVGDDGGWFGGFFVLAAIAGVVGFGIKMLLANKAIDTYADAERAKRTAPAPASPARPARPSAADRLRELDGLLASGLITADEHRSRRAAILAEL